MCGVSCVDPLTDSDNCGVCGMACPSGSACAAGECFCLVGLTACAGGCVDTTVDASHCGACNADCGSGSQCIDGQCSCSGDRESCAGECVDVQSDFDNCGACGTPCEQGEVCSAGQCSTTGCSGDSTECGGACVDTQSDAANCGGCGMPCPPGQSCARGVCACSEGELDCGQGCVDLGMSALHCGACDNVCASGVCNGGQCEAVDQSSGPIGWASVDGGTTGGGSGTPVDVGNVSEFNANVSGDTPRVIRITSNLSGNLEVSGSNKTILGANDSITINGGLAIENVSNVIVKNLRINGSSSSEDGMLIDNSHHVWVDHCEFWDAPDGNLDIKNAADYITISWTRFYYSNNPPSNDHRYSNLIGSGDGDTQDRGKLRVTWHHNWWADRVHERMPRVRFGQVHVFNNYYSSSGNNYCIRAGFEATLLVENNYFDGVDTPHEIDGAGASIVANDNVYNNTTGARDEGGSAFNPPYEYTLDDAATVADAVRAGAGPQ